MACKAFLAGLALALIQAQTARSQPGPMMFDFETGFGGGTVTTGGAKSALDGKGGWLITPEAGAGWKGVTLAFPAKDLSGYQGVMLAIRNTSATGMAVYGDIDNDASYPSIAGYVYVEPGETDTLLLQFNRTSASLPAYLPNYLKGMKGLPGGYTEHWEVIDPSQASRIKIYMLSPSAGRTLVVDNIRPWGVYALPTEAQLTSGFFPLLDSLGQYRHSEWPGKSASKASVAAQAQAEAADLAAHPGETDWDAYGGWSAGPKLTVTGKFRVEKVQGKWWLVDPDGRLFWSMGITCVNYYENTPVPGRENYFTAPPSDGNFRGANMKIKFGADWSAQANALAHQRLRSWGMNSMGNWSDKGIYGQKKTAYTVNFASGIAKAVPASLDTAGLRAATRKAVAALKPQIESDPFCIGVFSDNELDWPAGTAGAAVAEDYYRIMSQELHAAMPAVLYLGSRIHVAPEAVWRAAAKYCDVVSHNHYAFSLTDIGMPADVDKALMITEFHFGALDRGLAHPGLRAVFNQRQRARAFSDYVTQGITDPRVTGAHWFQYGDQAYTGRSDGENYQIGFLDVCDRPYPEMVAASRALAAGMYPLRYGGMSAVRAGSGTRGVRAARSRATVDMLGRREAVRPHAPNLLRLPAAP